MPKRRTPQTPATSMKSAKKEKPRPTTRSTTPSSAERNADDRETTKKKAPHQAPTQRGGDQPADEPPVARTGLRAANPEAPCRHDERETIFNGRKRGPAYRIEVPVEQVASIDCFLIDLDLKLLDPNVIGAEAAGSADAFYERHVLAWLDRDPVLRKAEVRNTGGGLHVLLVLDEPVIVAPGQQRAWDGVARGLHGVLPGDPNLSGIIAMTRPVGALNTKYDPPREVRLLREGQPVTRQEVLDLVERMTTAPARVWMNVLHGGERASSCPLCRGEGTSLGVAGNWQVQCYDCGRKDAAALIYRFYTPEFLTDRKEVHHG